MSRFDRQILEIGTGTVVTTGTPVRIKTSHFGCKHIVFQSGQDNAGAIVVGNSDVDGATTPPKGVFTLYNTQRDEVDTIDASTIYIDATADNCVFSYAILG